MHRMIDRRGFSLVEMSVALAIAGLVSLAVWQVVPSAIEAGRGANAPAEGPLPAARRAVAGYAIAEGRLPCADANGDGAEDCNASGQSLPWATLGLDRPGVALRYEADSTLTNAAPAAAHNPPGTGIATQNTLDYCVALRQAIAKNTTGVRVGGKRSGTQAAFAIAHPGPNGRFEGPHRNGNRFALPGRSGSDGDDRVVATGAAVLASRLDCPAQLSRSGIAGRQAAVTADLDAFSGVYRDFRDSALEARETNRQQAVAQSAILAASTAIAVAEVAVTVPQFTQGVSERVDDAPSRASRAEAIVMTTFLAGATAEAAARFQMAVTSFGLAGTRFSEAESLNDLTEAEHRRRDAAAESTDEQGVLP